MTPQTIDTLYVITGLAVYVVLLLASAPPAIRTVMSFMFKEPNK